MLSTKLVEAPNQVALRPRKQTIQSIVAMQMQLCKDKQQEPFFIMIREACSCGGHRFSHMQQF